MSTSKSGKSPRPRDFERVSSSRSRISSAEKTKGVDSVSTTITATEPTNMIVKRGGRSTRSVGKRPWRISGDVSGKYAGLQPRDILWIEVHSTPDEWMANLKQEMRNFDRGAAKDPHMAVSFSPERLRAFLSSERFRLVRLIRAKQPNSVYELAKLAGRPRMAVVQDLKVLTALGFVRLRGHRGSGRARSIPIVPYKAIRIAIDL